MGKESPRSGRQQHLLLVQLTGFPETFRSRWKQLALLQQRLIITPSSECGSQPFQLSISILGGRKKKKISPFLLDIPLHRGKKVVWAFPSLTPEIARRCLLRETPLPRAR